MTINIKDILTLSDNNDYVVVSKANYENKTYYYLIDKLDSGKILFCYQDNDELVEVRDKDLNTKLLPLFLKGSLKEINN
jgi:hypothetical protein